MLTEVRNVVDITADTMAGLLASKHKKGSVQLLGFHSKGDGGGGVFYWDATQDKANHNGGTIIDPDNTANLALWDATAQTTWFTAGTGTGCWVRQYETATVRYFGAKGDGTANDVLAIQSVIDTINTAGGGALLFPNGRYLCNSTITIPKDCNLRMVGERLSKDTSLSTVPVDAGPELKAGTGVTKLIEWNGDASVTISAAELARGFMVEHMILSGNGSTTEWLIDSLNSDSLVVQHCRLIDSIGGLRGTFNGTYSSPLLAGGWRIFDNNFGMSPGDCIYVDGHTQDWIRGNWFAGTGADHCVNINRSNKINMVDNEFDVTSAGTAVVSLNDSTGAETTKDITIVGNKIAGNAIPVIADNRTNAASYRVVFVGNVVAGPTIDEATWHNPAGNIAVYSRNTNSYLTSTYIDATVLTVSSVSNLNSIVSTGAYINVPEALTNSATPSVSGKRNCITGGTTTIIDFVDGQTGQEIIVLSEHAVTITDGTNIFLNGSVNFVMSPGDSLTLIQKSDGNWYEISRSVN